MLLSQHDAIINTASITAYAGAPTLIDYSASKGAIVSFTRSLSQNKDMLEKGIPYDLMHNLRRKKLSFLFTFKSVISLIKIAFIR